MRVTFGLALDGPHHPDLLHGRDAAAGEAVLGPLGFLDLLETRLGLQGRWEPPVVRRVQYARLLKESDDGRRFYSRSLEADELGVAGVLLDWRDELVRGGWDGRADGADSPRIGDLARIEQAGLDGKLSPGIADRLCAVLRRVPGRTCGMSLIQVVGGAEALPFPWPKVLASLREAGVRIEDIRPSLPEPAPGDLGRFQAALRDGGGSGASGDGSLVLLKVPSDAEGAEVAARWLETDPGGCVLVNPSRDAGLDEALRRRGLAATGMASLSPWRPPLQILPLAFAIRWEPLDPNRVLEFLTLPLRPIRKSASFRLARALVEAPGIGGPVWKKAIQEIETRARESSEEDSKEQTAEEVREAIDVWLHAPRFDPVEGIPQKDALDIAGRVANWAGALNAKRPDTLLAAAAAQASRFRDLLAGRGLPRIPRLLIERLLDTDTGSGLPSPGRRAEAGHIPVVIEPGALLAPADTVVWWNFASGTLPNPGTAPWTAEEKRWLSSRGVVIEDPSASRLREWDAQLAPFRLARRRIVLVSPDRIRGEASAPHPAWDVVVSVFRDTSPRLVQDADRARRARASLLGSDPGWADVKVRPLPAPRRWWRIRPGASLRNRETESYSSLADFVHHPFHWVLKHAARLQKGALGGLPDEAKIYGSLSHLLIGGVISDPALVARADPEEIRRVLAARLPGLLAESGAVFLGRGCEIQRETLLDRSARAATALARTLREGKWRLAGTEFEIRGAYFGGNLLAYLDVALSGDEGRRALIDIKWGGRKYRVEDLERNTALQLAIYAHLYRADGSPWPDAGYLVVEDAAILAWDPAAFPGAAPVSDAAGRFDELWRSFEATWRWRRDQLDRGLVEVTVKGTAPDGASVPPPGAMPMVPEHPFNEFAHLTGWTE